MCRTTINLDFFFKTGFNMFRALKVHENFVSTNVYEPCIVGIFIK